MSAFRDDVLSDLDDVFLDTDEFAEEHDLNGTLCNCIVDKPTAQGNFLGKSEKYIGYDTIHGIEALIHVKAADIGELPTEGQRFYFDGELFKVAKCVDHFGMLTITLQAHIIGTGEWDSD